MCLPSTSNVHSASTTPEPPPIQSQFPSTAHLPQTSTEGDSNDKNNLVAKSSSSDLKKASVAATPTTISSPYDVITIELNRKAGKGLGLSLSGKKINPRSDIFISRVIRGGVADSGSPDALAHQILRGDQVLEVNGQSLSQMSFEDATVLLKVSTILT